jgi:hypothetical protein
LELLGGGRAGSGGLAEDFFVAGVWLLVVASDGRENKDSSAAAPELPDRAEIIWTLLLDQVPFGTLPSLRRLG